MVEREKRKKPVVRSRIVKDLLNLGVRRGGLLMVHANLGRLGPVVGKSQSVIEALLDALSPDGTLLAYTGWDDNPFHLAEQSQEWQTACRAELPAFDVLRSRARRQCGPLAERLRTWPGAIRSNHPEASFVALGANAEALTADQDRNDPYGVRSPLGHLVKGDGQVLLLGAPLDQITLVHHAESIAKVRQKRRVQYEMPVKVGENVRWERFDDIDTSAGAFPYEAVIEEDILTFLSKMLKASGLVNRGTVGRASSYLFSAPRFADYAARWMEDTFGP